MSESKTDMNNLHPCIAICRDAVIGVDPSILTNNTCEILCRKTRTRQAYLRIV